MPSSRSLPAPRGLTDRRVEKGAENDFINDELIPVVKQLTTVFGASGRGVLRSIHEVDTDGTGTATTLYESDELPADGIYDLTATILAYPLTPSEVAASASVGASYTIHHVVETHAEGTVNVVYGPTTTTWFESTGAMAVSLTVSDRKHLLQVSDGNVAMRWRAIVDVIALTTL